MSERRHRGLGAALAALIVVSLPGAASADSGWLNIHVEGAPAFFLTQPQSDWYGTGGAAALRVDYSPISRLGIQASALFAQFPQTASDFDFEAQGLRAPGASFAVFVTLGLRVRLLNDQGGYALAWRRRPGWRHEGNLHGNLWLDAAAAYVRTGDLDRAGLEVGLGYELSLVDGLQLGPFLRYLHVFQPDDQLEDSDAMILLAGVSFTVAIPSHVRSERIPDSDGDGVLDPDDACPAEPEDRDGIEDADGCPDPDEPVRTDRDGDGIVDAEDACPDEREDVDGFEDDDGCPDPDHDGDGIVDADDACPTEPEVVNGVDDGDGCPDEADIEVIADDILLSDRIYFDFALARIRGRSWPLLEQIARLLEVHPEYTLVSIEGHCDYIGSDEVNQALSERRAQRVVDFLVGRGIERERFRAVGFGRSRPTRQGTSEWARQMNRRVEFRIVGVSPALQRGQALPRTDPAAAPRLGPGGVVAPPGAEDGETGAEDEERRP
jgi:outer membrane protein OmpA-like peptidoglycan-associated protein